jgi:hypothetical protein
VHSYVSPDRRKTFCGYDGPDEAAIHWNAEKNGLRWTPYPRSGPWT